MTVAGLTTTAPGSPLSGPDAAASAWLLDCAQHRPSPPALVAEARRRRIRPGIWRVLLLALVSPIRGDLAADLDFTTLSLDELGAIRVPIVTGASGHGQTSTEAPSSVSVVTREEIQRQGHRTLADILRSVRGFYVTSDRSYGYIGLRGLNRPGDYGGRVLVTLDGHRLNDPIYDQAGVTGEFPLDVDLIERVEVIRGPASSLYGNNTLLTVVNIIPRRGLALEGVEASLSAASQDTYTGRLTYGQQFTNGLDLVLSGSLWSSAGHDALYFQEFRDQNQGRAEKLDNEYAHKWFAAATYGDFTLTGLYGARHKETPTAPYASLFNASPADTEDTRGVLALRWNHDFDHEWAAAARLYYDYYRYEGLYPYAGSDPLDPDARLINEDHVVGQSWGIDAQVSKVLAVAHRLTLGAEFRDALQLWQRNRDLDPPATYVDVESDVVASGVYLQDEWAARTNLLFNVGVRYDHYSTFGDTVNPRAAVIWTPWPSTTWKAIYGQAYRSPNVYELYYEAEGYRSNPDLASERVRSYELVWEQHLGPHWRVTGSGFFSEARRLITLVEEPEGWIYRNTESVDVHGLELEVETAWDWLQGRASYTYANARDHATDGRLSNAPEHLGKLALSVPLWRDRVFASLEVQGMSGRRTVQDTTVEGHVVVNCTLFSRELLPGLEFSASLYNVFDATYHDPVSADYLQPAIEQDGRSFRVKLRQRF